MTGHIRSFRAAKTAAQAPRSGGRVSPYRLSAEGLLDHGDWVSFAPLSLCLMSLCLCFRHPVESGSQTQLSIQRLHTNSGKTAVIRNSRNICISVFMRSPDGICHPMIMKQTCHLLLGEKGIIFSRFCSARSLWQSMMNTNVSKDLRKALSKFIWTRQKHSHIQPLTAPVK
ncbi:hypothetical protein SKAU_G00324960 [Synaphobranchus kaupii]|uniref:Uncharacterized protein n=1 Tax=Synaphobranchus kaupii TaxID=118154 RepID=A0A9Q1II12_SYNKA|nr:hypothetical protein SKAU_G00324960 [Synaphobranchus kaupii]